HRVVADVGAPGARPAAGGADPVRGRFPVRCRVQRGQTGRGGRPLDRAGLAGAGHRRLPRRGGPGRGDDGDRGPRPAGGAAGDGLAHGAPHVRPAGAPGAGPGRAPHPAVAAPAPPPLRLPRHPADVASDQHPQRAESPGRLLRPAPVRPDPRRGPRHDGRPGVGGGRRLGGGHHRRGTGRGGRPARHAPARRRRTPPRPGPRTGGAGPDRRRAVRRGPAAAHGAGGRRHDPCGDRVSLLVYLGGLMFGLTSVLLARRPRAALRNPLTLSTWLAIVLGALVFVCAAPPTLAAVNDLTGIPNFGAPLTYGMLNAYSCAVLVLLINWRGGPRARVRRLVLRTVAAYGLLTAAIVALFALAGPDTERLTDLDTYYATTPYLREMILLYLLGHSAAMLALCLVCLKWGREVTGSLRTGLRLIVLGALLDLVGFQLAKYTAVVARWTGHDLEVLSPHIAPPMASLAALLCSAGFLLPRLLPPVLAHRRALVDHRRLEPLWALVGPASTTPGPPAASRLLPQERLQWREVAIHDALLALAPYFDHRLRERVRDAALAAGSTPHRARLTAEAAMLTEAARRAAARAEPPQGSGTYRLHATEVSGTGGLVELAQALTRPPAAPDGTVPSAMADPMAEPEEPHVA